MDRYMTGRDYDLITRNLPERLYSKTKGLWHIPFRDDYQQWVPQQYNIISDLEFLFPDCPDSTLPHIFDPFLKAYTESMILKRLSPRTCDIYLESFKRFLSQHAGSDINALSYRDLLNYLKVQAVQLHPTTLKQTIAALKFYYERTLGRDKMFFALAKHRKVKLSILHLPFCDLKELIVGIDSPGDKLLLFLVYHANIKLSDICTLPKDAAQVFNGQHHMPGNNEEAINYFKALVEECHKQYHLNTFLIENNGQAHSVATLKCKLYKILAPIT
jgi:site-specific recombinase XerD